MKKIYNLTIEPLTAVHVGSGNVLTPLEYKIAKTSSGHYKYIRFSSDSIMGGLRQTRSSGANSSVFP